MRGPSWRHRNLVWESIRYSWLFLYKEWFRPTMHLWYTPWTRWRRTRTKYIAKHASVWARHSSPTCRGRHSVLHSINQRNNRNWTAIRTNPWASSPKVSSSEVIPIAKICQVLLAPAYLIHTQCKSRLSSGSTTTKRGCSLKNTSDNHSCSPLAISENS